LAKKETGPMIRFLALILALSPVLPWPEREWPEMEMKPQEATFELDHFFVAVPGPDTGVDLLDTAGFLLGTPHEHSGQGTASRGVLFENVYLELIWLTDSEEAGSPPIRRTRLGERMDSGSGACPFGLGLRRKGEVEVALPFETWDYRPPYLPEGVSFQMGANSESLEEPLVFFMPWLAGRAWPSSAHPNGARRVTRLEMVLSDDAVESATVQVLSKAKIASILSGTDFFLDVELDGGQSGGSLDLRPEVPLRLKW
jgi:hypothetical protein